MIYPIPPFHDNQYSSTGIDADNCVEQALCHAIWMLTGRRYSPRALGWMVDVQPSGSEVSQAIAVANARGLIPYDLWPNLETFTWDEYYADIPPSILAQADFYHIEEVPANLAVSPLLDELVFNPAATTPGPYHLVAQFSDTQYFDSERWNGDASPVRDLTFLGAKVVWSSSIKLTPLKIQMTLVNDNGTYYLVGEAGKLGIADEGSLALIQSISNHIIVGSSGPGPQVGTLTHNDAFVIHK